MPCAPPAPRVAPLLCRGVYGAPGGDGLDSLARLILSLVAEFADAVESGKNQLAPQRILRIYMRAETLAAEVLPLAILASR